MPKLEFDLGEVPTTLNRKKIGPNFLTSAPTFHGQTDEKKLRTDLSDLFLNFGIPPKDVSSERQRFERKSFVSRMKKFSASTPEKK